MQVTPGMQVNPGGGLQRDGGVPPAALAQLADNPAGWALFLDVDGTLIDIAPTPDAVAAPAGLADCLAGVSAGLAGAMALVTGRAIGFVDRLFHPHRFPLAGLHGAEVRLADGRRWEPELGQSLVQARELLSAGVEHLPGVVLEDKGAAVALHFRLAPQHRDAVENLMRDAAELAGPSWTRQRGKMLVELKPAGADKGAAVRSLMDTAPFRGRRPLAIGDDLTDEDMFAAAIAHGGQALRIGGDDGQRSLASGRLNSPAALRDMLARIHAGWGEAGDDRRDARRRG